ncbi:hypothetical protein COI73_30935, partial [Bacillus cereus]
MYLIPEWPLKPIIVSVPLIEEFGKKSLDGLGIQVIWGDNNWGAEKAVTIGYSAKTPFNPL